MECSCHAQCVYVTGKASLMPVMVGGFNDTYTYHQCNLAHQADTVLLNDIIESKRCSEILSGSAVSPFRAIFIQPLRSCEDMLPCLHLLHTHKVTIM